MSAHGARTNRNANFLAAKLERLHQPHVAPLTAFVEQIRAETGGEVPWFDPDNGGVRARALLLLEAPGARSTATTGPRSTAAGSGVISADNNDASAAAMWGLYREAGLEQDRIAVWNIVPWYLGSPTKIRAAGRSDLELSQPYLHRLVTLLPELRVVLALGVPARDGWLRYLLTHDGPLLPTLACPHPSPRVLNTRPESRDLILAALRRVQDVISVCGLSSQPP